jgi:hypothetical protein
MAAGDAAAHAQLRSDGPVEIAEAPRSHRRHRGGQRGASGRAGGSTARPC